MVDFAKYQPPGLYTESVAGPQLSVQSATPTAIGFFGTTVGYRQQIEALTVDPDVQQADNTFAPAVNRTLRQSGIRTDTIVVRDANSGVPYILNTDYTIKLVSGGQSATSTRDDTYTIQRVIAGGHIDQGDQVEISYNYTDENYFDDQLFYDYDDVREAYGSPFDAAGNVQSELALAVSFAFVNGADRVVCVAVDPVDKANPTLADYQNALDKLKDVPDISVIVPATGIQGIQGAVQAHVAQQSANRYERRAIIGRDGTGAVVTSNQLIADANSLSDSRVALVSPATMRYYAPELNREIPLGGQYLAAAAAGISVRQLSSEPLTRKQVRGFVDVGVKSPEQQRNLESQNGLMVAERQRSGILQVRHGVTTDASNTLTREWNVIGQQDTMVYRLRAYLDNSNLIGGIIDELTMTNVKASADAALQSLVADRVINDYQELKVRQLGTQPDVIEVRYGWKPSLPLNYIVVRYSVNTTTGDTAVQSI